MPKANELFMRVYVNRILNSSAYNEMTAAQRGAYCTLLFVCFQAEGKLPANARALQVQSKCSADEWRCTPDDLVMRQFVPHPDAPECVTHPLVLAEVEAMQAVSAAKKRGAEARWAIRDADAMHMHSIRTPNGMQKETENKTEIDSSLRSESTPPTPQGGVSGGESGQSGDGPTGAPTATQGPELALDLAQGQIVQPGARGAAVGASQGEGTGAAPPKAKPKPAKSPQPPLPPVLLQAGGPELAEAWADWGEHLQQKNKGATQKAWEMQLRQLIEFGPIRALAALRHSTRNNYTGIYEPSTNGHRTTAHPGGRLSPPARTAEGIAAAVAANLRRSGDL